VDLEMENVVLEMDRALKNQAEQQRRVAKE
jgi:hypothetical protein